MLISDESLSNAANYTDRSTPSHTQILSRMVYEEGGYGTMETIPSGGDQLDPTVFP